MFVLTIIYPNGREWVAGGFPSQEAVDHWILEQKAHAGWNDNVQVKIDQQQSNPVQAGQIKNQTNDKTWNQMSIWERIKVSFKP